MNNSFPTRSMVNPLRRTKTPGEAELYALFQILSGPALLIDNGKEQILQANSAYLQLTAYALKEIIGRPLRDLVDGLPSHPLSADEVHSATLLRRNRPPLDVNANIRLLDASGQWLVLVFEPVEETQKSWQARIEQIVRTMADLSENPPEDAPVRQPLLRSLSMISELLDCTSAAVYRISEDGTEVRNIAEVGELGLLPERFASSDLLRFSQTFIWKPGRRVQTELHRLARVQNLSYLASSPISQNGILVVAERKQDPLEYLAPLLSAIGKQISVLFARAHQVVDLRHKALENRRELGIWRSVGENAQEGILLLAPDLTVMEMNPAAEWMLGYAEWEVKSQQVENILIGPERLSPALEMACSGIPTHNMGNVSLHRRNGQSFPAHIQIIPVQREGVTLALVIFFTDVSEHEEIRTRTQQLEQRAVLGEVTAVFAHEVRNPINNISTGLQLLSVKLPESDPNQENIARLLNDCARLNHLMESVLNFSRHSEHKFEAVDLEIFLRRLLERWRPRMAKVNVEYFFQIEEHTPKVLGDPRSLEQVFTNLVSNAVEAMSSKGGTLAVKVAPFNHLPGRQQVEITISDDGPGIPDEVRERIFEPFVTTKSQGTGLGLAITKRIVTAHRGSISVNSFPGGTVFHVILSAHQGEAE